MENRANIAVHRKEIAWGRYENTYEWVGNRRWPVRIDRSFLDSKDELPWKLKCLSENDYMYCGSSLFVRTDVSFWWIRTVGAWLKRSFDWFNHRLIMTAMVWGLVLVPMGEIPTWKGAIEGRRRKL